MRVVLSSHGAVATDSVDQVLTILATGNADSGCWVSVESIFANAGSVLGFLIQRTGVAASIGVNELSGRTVVFAGSIDFSLTSRAGAYIVDPLLAIRT